LAAGAARIDQNASFRTIFHQSGAILSEAALSHVFPGQSHECSCHAEELIPMAIVKIMVENRG
jgi:hypothetical protein